MPPVRTITKNDILLAAFSLLQKKGINALNARSIAKKLNISTQPIYWNYKNISELRNAVIQKAWDYNLEYLLSEKEEDLFLSIGMQYVRFAKNEPCLFKLLYMSGNEQHNPENYTLFTKSLVNKMQKAEYFKSASKSQLQQILHDMWIFTHGLITFGILQGKTISEDLMKNELMRVGSIFINSLKKK